MPSRTASTSTTTAAKPQIQPKPPQATGSRLRRLLQRTGSAVRAAHTSVVPF
ncbi:hypothetical protein SAMN05443637_11114 [Pseudonocardia thermophila]|jgi:hypothetical protein|uniref:Uncharacterized protein n=1 Tax=Pseudonocardia thermophila TaxID=1848 RepID=A0A1M6UU43_PSETH|nr:hypothetical protein SAMN05443637_11114 [Pseudonocardia thermophila]